MQSIQNESLQEWKAQIEQLADQESSAPWTPYPDHYVDTRIPIDLNVPQISLSTNSPATSTIFSMRPYQMPFR